MSFLVNTRNVGDELFLRKLAFHKVANTATRNDVSPNVPLFIANAINARIFHTEQPFSIRASSVRRRLPTIKTICRNYLGYLFNRKIELSSIGRSLTAILAVDSSRTGLSGTLTREANAASKPAFFPNSAGPGIFQMGNRKRLFSSTSAAHNPMVYRHNPPFPSRPGVRPGMTDNLEIPKFLVCNVNEVHRKDSSMAASWSYRERKAGR
jgi:hypothetical protein